jgi:hypothetical protein
VTTQTIPFTDHGTTQQSRHGGGPAILVTADLAGTGLAQLVPSAPSGRLYIAAFQGARNTGGYAIQIERIERTGDRLTVHAALTAPRPGSLTIQVLTSPAHLVSIDRQSASGVREAVVVDRAGTEIARTTVTQSQP